MAFDSSNLTRIGGGNGFGLYRYDTTDALTTVDTDGYMNNDDDTLNLRVGDIIEVVVWPSVVGSGVPSDWGRHMVTQVTNGSVNLSTDIYGATLVTGD